MTHKPHTPPQPVFEAVGEKPDFGALAAKLSDALNDHCITTSTRGAFINVVGFSEIDKALQQAHEAGVAQGRKDEREYIASFFDKRVAKEMAAGEMLTTRLWGASAEIVRELPPQGDKK